MSTKKKRIFITGANRGIGLELVKQLLIRGKWVWAACRQPDHAAALQGLARTYPGQLRLVEMDVAALASIQAASQAVKLQVEALDLLINNAAINRGDEDLPGVHPEVLEEVWRVNALGPLLVAQAFAELLRAGQEAKLVNISSEAGSITRMGSFRGYSYYGSKAALNMFTRSLSLDPNLKGVTVIAMHPGWVRTDMGGPAANLSTEESASGILQVIAGLSPADSGNFFTYAGEIYPW